MNNRLFATFFPRKNKDVILQDLINKYTILYNKIFILDIIDSPELVCTYNIDTNNINGVLSNTILVHRKKISNTLYSLNSLNFLIKKLNNGVLDKDFPINWNDYKNCFLLTKNGELRRLDTKLDEIISL